MKTYNISIDDLFGVFFFELKAPGFDCQTCKINHWFNTKLI